MNAKNLIRLGSIELHRGEQRKEAAFYFEK